MNADDFVEATPRPPVSVKKTKKRKITHDWSEESVFQLINEVECNHCIWNAASADYHNKLMRDNAWKEIASVLNISVEEVTSKWSNLRIQYRQYFNKKTKSGQGAESSPKWKYYDCMSFVGRAEVQQRQTTTTNFDITLESDASTSSSFPASKAPTTLMDTFCDAVKSIKDRRKENNVNDEFGRYIVSELNSLEEFDARTIRNKMGLFLLKEIAIINDRKQKENINPELETSLNNLLNE